MTPTELPHGTLFAGHEILGVAGRGGMGVVYRARQLDLDRTVALKLIAPSLAEDPSFRERFIRESRVAASLDHPNVIPVFSAGEEDGVLYLAMRFVQGDDLRTLVRREGPLSGPRAAQIVRQVGAALDAAHTRGVVHRDVKPANVLLGEGDHAYLTDFGLTKRVDSAGGQTRPGGWVGTLGYVAPEQIRGERVDARTDVYALGCVLHHALSGEAPYRRDSDEATMWAHLHDDPPPLVVEGLSPAFDAVVARALAKDPAERFPSAGDLGRAALAAADGRADLAAAAGRVVATGAAAPQGRDDRPTAAPQPPAPATDPDATRTGTPATDRVPGGPPTPATDQVTPTGPTAAGPTATGGRAGGARRPVAIAAAAAVLLAAGGIGAALLLGDGDEPTTPRTATTGSTTTTTDRPRVARVTATLSAGSRPNDVAAGPRGLVWIVSNPDRRMSLVDGDRDRRGDRQPEIGPGAQSVAAGLGRIWVVKNGTNSLIQLSDRSGVRTGAATVRLPAGEPVRVRTGEGAVWVGIRGSAPVSPDMVETVVKIDPSSGTQQSIAVRGGVQDLDVGAGAVWVTGRGSETVTRIDARTGAQRRSSTGRMPRGVAVGGGSVWVANSAEGSVTRIAVDDATDRDRVRVGTAPRGVAYGAGGVWVTNELDDTVTRIDPRSSEVVGEPIDGVGRRPAALSARGDRVWVVSPQDGTVAEIRVP
ncbi:protein kinase [Conexibacter sp. W3-3-2]|uniref:protein kinase domain-containing protein n=1 Tax=Conexibacter sp. W3-3-2 TaxID=2675227 RepID=UPI0028152822|nr:protein kinase [Conexibacter sp. W3-3-2]